MLKWNRYDFFSSSYRILPLKLLPVVVLMLEVLNVAMELRDTTLELCSCLDTWTGQTLNNVMRMILKIANKNKCWRRRNFSSGHRKIIANCRFSYILQSLFFKISDNATLISSLGKLFHTILHLTTWKFFPDILSYFFLF